MTLSGLVMKVVTRLPNSARQARGRGKVVEDKEPEPLTGKVNG